MTRLLKLPPAKPKNPAQDPEVMGLLAGIEAESEQILHYQEEIARIAIERSRKMRRARDKGVSLRKIAHAARIASPQTVLNQLDSMGQTGS